MDKLLDKLCSKFASSLWRWFEHSARSDDPDSMGVWVDTLAVFFALEQCQSVFHDIQKPLVCRFSLDHTKKRAKTKLHRFLTKMRATELQKNFAKRALPKLSEFLFDFSLSKYSIPQATGRGNIEPRSNNEKFSFLLIAESEMHGPDAVFEDCLKLTVAPAAFKVMVFHARTQKSARRALTEGIEQVLENGLSFDDEATWLFIGVPRYSQWESKANRPDKIPRQFYSLDRQDIKLVDISDLWTWE